MASTDTDIFPHWWEDNDLLLMLDAGYDEGGGDGTLLISLQLGQTKRLRRFSKKWKKVLKAAGVGFWHSKDYDNYTGGVFHGLDRRERSHLLGKLSRLIQDYMDVGFTARIDTAMYNSETTASFRNTWGTAFCYGVEMTLLTAFANLLDRDRGREIFNVLLSDGHVNVGQALDHITSAIKQGGLMNIKTCSQGANRDWPILQAADMLAYSEWKYLTQSGREIFEAINLDSRPYRTYLFDCDEKLIALSKQGVEAFLAEQKAFGRRIKLNGI